jgi:hypothetical protein
MLPRAPTYLLTEAKSGFTEKKSADTARQTFIGSTSKQVVLDEGLHTTQLFFDLSKAHDVINHCTLLDNLNPYRTGGGSNLWFMS